MTKSILILMVFISINNINLGNVYASNYDSISSILSTYKNEIITLEDLDQDTRQYFIESEKGKTPGIVMADFNGDGVEDVVLLTKDELVFFICQKRGCKRIERIWTGGLEGLKYIIPVKAGQVIEGTENISSEARHLKMKLSHTAICFVIYGKSTVVYFWDKKKRGFESITIAD